VVVVEAGGIVAVGGVFGFARVAEGDEAEGFDKVG